MTEKKLSMDGLETVYDALATAIDQAGAEKSELFLVKLALLMPKPWATLKSLKRKLQQRCKTCK